MYSIVCVSLSYDTRNVFSLFLVKYKGSCLLNRKTIRILLCPCIVPDPKPETLGPPGSVIICTDPDPDPPINKQKNNKNLDFHSFGT